MAQPQEGGTPQEQGGLLSAGNVPSTGAADRSATGLEFQKLQGGTNAAGDQLGVGLRSVTSVAPISFTSQKTGMRSMSGAQFGNGHAKSLAGTDESENE